jgi:hypothetical protein
MAASKKLVQPKLTAFQFQARREASDLYDSTGVLPSSVAHASTKRMNEYHFICQELGKEFEVHVFLPHTARVALEVSVRDGCIRLDQGGNRPVLVTRIPQQTNEATGPTQVILSAEKRTKKRERRSKRSDR